MFKKYKFEWTDGEHRSTVDFYVNSKGTRSGFMHRACVIGGLPRLDGIDSEWGTYRTNDDKLFAARYHRKSYINRTWEYWSGQECLKGLWNKLCKLKFVDMARISPVNPFESSNEPEHEHLDDPDELFGGFTRR